MTFEQMQEIAREIAAVLTAAGYAGEYLEEDAKLGEPLPIAFRSKDGDDLVLALDVL